MGSAASQHPDGTTEVLTRRSGQWITLDTGSLRTALTVLGQVQPGLTTACDHGYRVDNLIAALAHNREAEYDNCLIDALLQVAVLGAVTYGSPADDEQQDGYQQGGRAAPQGDFDLDGDRSRGIAGHHRPHMSPRGSGPA